MGGAAKKQIMAVYNQNEVLRRGQHLIFAVKCVHERILKLENVPCLRVAVEEPQGCLGKALGAMKQQEHQVNEEELEAMQKQALAVQRKAHEESPKKSSRVCVAVHQRQKDSTGSSRRDGSSIIEN